MNFLEIQSVRKQFQDHLAVDNVSLSVPKGKIYGLLGPNGAGKTTIIRMITGIIMPDSGQINLDGAPLKKEDSSRIGYMPEERGLYKKTKVIEQIVYLLRLKGMDKTQAQKTAMDWLARMGLGDWANKLTTDLSKGMQQKVQFISTVAHEPDLLILDEPVSGLDPVNVKVMENEIRHLKEKGKTIIFSTHRLEQVEELCDNVALIHKGNVLLEGTLQDVRQQFQRNTYKLSYIGEASAFDNWSTASVEIEQEGKALLHVTEGVSGKMLLQSLMGLPIEIQRFERDTPRLSDIFIQMVGSPEDLNRINEG